MDDVTFNDLRHFAKNNLKLTDNDQFDFKQASGHKTDSVFQRTIF